MYRIMLVAREGKNIIDSYYQYMTVVDSLGNTVIYETDNVSELDAKVEEMLNGDYAKKDFIIISEKDYRIDADIY